MIGYIYLVMNKINDVYKSMRVVIIKSDNKNNFLILVFYDERSIINRCRKLVDNNFKKWS